MADAFTNIENNAGRLAYQTYALMTADKINIPANSIIEITNDTDDKNGVYVYDGITFVKSAYDPVALSKTYTDTAIASKIYVRDLSSLAFVIADEQGNIGFALGVNAEILSPTIKRIDAKLLSIESRLGSGTTPNSPITPLPVGVFNNYKSDYMHVFSYGQSLSRGAGGIPLISTTQPYQNKTFSAGVLARYANNAGFQSFKPLVEMVDGTDGETPTSAMLNSYVKKQIEKGELATNWQMIGTAPGRGGQPITKLNKGTIYYTGLIAQVQAAYNISQMQGKTYSVYAMAWTQGENDYAVNTTQQGYYDLLVKLKNDFTADIKAITNQNYTPPWVMYQTVSHREYGKENMQIALAQLQLANTVPDIVMACSIYHLPHYPDDLHLTQDSYYQLGLYYAKALDYTLSTGDKWQPLQPTNIAKQGKILDIEFSKSGLAIDTTLVAATHNKGFDLWSGGVLLDTITSVTVSDTNRVRLILSAIPPVGAILSYGKGHVGDPVAGGPITGPRGNLRDNAGDTDNYVDTQNVRRYMHNWCVMFEQTI